MRRVATAFALAVALGGAALPSAATRAAEIGPQSIVAHPAPPDLAALLQRGNPPLVCHLAHSAVRDRQGPDLDETLEGTLAKTAQETEGLTDLVARAPTRPAPNGGAGAVLKAGEPAPASPADEDAVTPADVMLMVAALALASLSVLVVRG